LKTEKEGIVRETSPLKLDISLTVQEGCFALADKESSFKNKPARQLFIAPKNAISPSALKAPILFRRCAHARLGANDKIKNLITSLLKVQYTP
jgi:hypothetical protein